MADTKISLLDATNTTALKAKVGAPASEITLYNSANQSITNATITAVSFDTEEVDASGLSSGTVTYVTVPTGATECRAWFHSSWAGNGTGERLARVVENNSSNVRVKNLCATELIAAGAIGHQLEASCGWRPVTAANRIAAQVYQSSGGALNIIGGAITADPSPCILRVEFR